jgi:hypothetical protein
MGGTGLNLSGAKDAKSAENENDGGGEVSYSSVNPVQAIQVVLQQPAPDPNSAPITAPQNSQASALQSLGPVNQINRNETADNQLKAASDATTKIATAGAQLDKISKMGAPDVTANMTPVTPAPSIPAPTMGGGSSFSTSRKKDRGEETVWKPSTFDATMAAVNFSAAPDMQVAQNAGLRTQGGQRLDLGTIGGTRTSLDGMDTKGIGFRIAQTGATLNSVQTVARMINTEAGRENKGPGIAYKPPTPSAPSVPTGMV